MLRSEALDAWLVRGGVDPGWYGRQVEASRKCDKRYIRLSAFDRKGNRVEPKAAAVLRDFPQASAVAWAPGFYELPGDAEVKGVPSYEQGVVHGMDVASGYAVQELQVKPGHKVLDLCCAPGAKLCMLADAMDRHGELVGIDASRSRGNICCSMLKKYRSALPSTSGNPWELVLSVQDGTCFTSPWVAGSVLWSTEAEQALVEAQTTGGQENRKKLSKRKRNELEKIWQSKRRRLEDGQEGPNRTLFDRVLVDAECTHDGSIKHMAKYNAGGAFEGKDIPERFTKPEPAAAELRELQRGLLSNGFRLLEPGGVLIYSTCSFCKTQNEDIVQWFLDSTPSAKLLPVTTSGVPGVESSDLSGTIRFEPVASGTSGLYVAKLSKLPESVPEEPSRSSE
mmetsp:Transcript_19562/g.36146  ORF Transcript_19562/g.36146 Transcript_19562/m.36146 type:complete len:395 (+) Transcript_19562:34-1218(+)